MRLTPQDAPLVALALERSGLECLPTYQRIVESGALAPFRTARDWAQANADRVPDSD